VYCPSTCSHRAAGADAEIEYGGLLVGGLIKRGVIILGSIIPGFILVFVSMKCLLGTCDHSTHIAPRLFQYLWRTKSRESPLKELQWPHGMLALG
jgi:hypothetical protein